MVYARKKTPPAATARGPLTGWRASSRSVVAERRLQAFESAHEGGDLEDHARDGARILDAALVRQSPGRAKDFRVGTEEPAKIVN